MLQKNIISYFDDKMSQFSSQLKIAEMSDNPDAVHDLRVNIKKIRSLIRTFRLHKKNRKIKRMLKNNIGNIFSKAGKIRDLQVQNVLVKDYEKILNKEFFNLKDFISVKIKSELKRFRKILPGDPVVFFNPFFTEISAVIEAMEEKKAKNSIVHFVDDRIRKFNKTRVRFYSKKLHKQRKILKELRFMYEMLLNMPLQLDFEDQVLRIKEVEELLGRWNDYNMLKVSLENHLRKLRKPDSAYVIKINALSETISNDIVNLLDNYQKLIVALKPAPVVLQTDL
ncbi:MAG: CHAD domain-containing protein [Bacteroidales bacterium]